MERRAPRTESTAKEVFLTGPQVQRRYQKSHVSIWRWVEDSELGFPKPIKIRRLNYFRLSELEEWESAQAGNV